MLELLDTRTIFLTGSLVAGAFAPVMFAIMRMRKTYPGYGSWALSQLAFAIVFLMQALRGLVSNLIPVLVGNIAACFAMGLLASGTYKFCERRERTNLVYFASAIFLAGILYFYFIRESFLVRTLFAGSYLAFMAAYAALPLSRRAPRGRQFGYCFGASILIFGALIGIVRVFAVARMVNMTTIFFPAPINTAFYLTDLMFIIGISFSYFLLTNERTVADLRDSNLAFAHEVGERQKVEAALRSEMTERKLLEVKLKELVITDPLTGVLNRRGLTEALKVEIRRADRQRSPLSVLILDLDRFKEVNDTHGHAAGDQALVFFARTCRGNLRLMDTIGRLGGEEFAILLPATDIGGAAVAAEKLRAAIGHTSVEARDVSFFMTVSIGIAAWTTSDLSGELVLAQADRALYAAKESGRNRVCLAETAAASPSLYSPK